MDHTSRSKVNLYVVSTEVPRTNRRGLQFYFRESTLLLFRQTALSMGSSKVDVGVKAKRLANPGILNAASSIK